MNTRENVNLIPDTSHRFLKQRSLYEPVVILAESVEQTHHRHLIEDHFRRRHEQFAVKCGWEPTTSTGMEYDVYDSDGHCDYVFLVHQNNQIVSAGCRLIRSKPGVNLPIQKFLSNPESVPVGSIEISRMTSTPEVAHYSFLKLLIGHLIDHDGISSAYVIMRKRLLQMYRRNGLTHIDRLPGMAMEKVSRDGRKENFLPVLLGLVGFQQSLHARIDRSPEKL